MYNSLKILNELINKQRKDVPSKSKFQYSDFKRVCHYINRSIFLEDKCCIWSIPKPLRRCKKRIIPAVNFYFNNKRVTLTRLLYINFIDDISDREYIHAFCKNRGSCVNLNHIEKRSYKDKKVKFIKDVKIAEQKINGSYRKDIIISFE